MEGLCKFSWLLIKRLLKNPVFLSNVSPRFNLRRDVFSWKTDVIVALSLEFWVAFMYCGGLSSGIDFSFDLKLAGGNFEPSIYTVDSLLFFSNTEDRVWIFRPG